MHIEFHHLQDSSKVTAVALGFIRRKLPVRSHYKWTVSPGNPLLFSNLPFFSMPEGQKSEKNHLVVYLQERVQKQRTVSVSQTRKQTFEKKRVGAYYTPSSRSQKYHPNPIHKYTYLSAPIPPHAVQGMVFFNSIIASGHTTFTAISGFSSKII